MNRIIYQPPARKINMLKAVTIGAWAAPACCVPLMDYSMFAMSLMTIPISLMPTLTKFIIKVEQDKITKNFTVQHMHPYLPGLTTDTVIKRETLKFPPKYRYFTSFQVRDQNDKWRTYLWNRDYVENVEYKYFMRGISGTDYQGPGVLETGQILMEHIDESCRYMDNEQVLSICSIRIIPNFCKILNLQNQRRLLPRDRLRA